MSEQTASIGPMEGTAGLAYGLLLVFASIRELTASAPKITSGIAIGAIVCAFAMFWLTVRILEVKHDE